MKFSWVGVALAVVLLGFGETQQVRDRAFVESVAISTDENHVYTSVRLYDDTSTYKGIGEDVSTALTSSQLRQPNQYFLGHTELIVFYSTPTLETVLSLLDNEVSPNCAVVVADSEVSNTEYAYKLLQSYERLNQFETVTASDLVRSLTLGVPIDVPQLSSDYSYTTTTINNS
jgi:hypothetical protein